MIRSQSLRENWGPFSPQIVEFDKVMTYTMPAQPLEDHYGSGSLMGLREGPEGVVKVGDGTWSQS